VRGPTFDALRPGHVGSRPMDVKGIGMAIVWIISGLMAAALGGAVWAIVAHVTGYEIGWIAIGLGALVGFAVGSTAGKRAGVVTATASCVFAFLGVMLGQLGTLGLAVDAELRSIRSTRISDELATSFIADDIVDQRTTAGIEIVWPQTLQNDADPSSDYPADIWIEAQKQWAMMTASEREHFRNNITESAAREIEQIDVTGYLVGGLDLKSIFFYAVAIAAAFRLGMGKVSGPRVKSSRVEPQYEDGNWLTRLTPGAPGDEPARTAPVPAQTPTPTTPQPAVPKHSNQFRGFRGLPEIPVAEAPPPPPSVRPVRRETPEPGTDGGVFRPDRLAS
jgi:hypothetical protein